MVRLLMPSKKTHTPWRTGTLFLLENKKALARATLWPAAFACPVASDFTYSFGYRPYPHPS